MANWEEILALLPPCIRDVKLLDSLAAIDAQMRRTKDSGSVQVEAHYANGSLKLIRLRPPSVDFLPLTFPAP